MPKGLNHAPAGYTLIWHNRGAGFRVLEVLVFSKLEWFYF